MFRPELRHVAERRQQMLMWAKDALNGAAIVPFYQPKVSLVTGKIIGFEALLRWYDEAGQLRSPGEIAAAFEDADLSVRITDRIIEGLMTDCRNWRSLGVDYGRVAFNVTAGDFRRGDLAQRILMKINDAGVPASDLELEVTESIFLGDIGSLVQDALVKLCEAGVTVALDDFGTGYASLTHILQFPVDVLKIDQSFVAKLLDEDRSSAAIVDAILGLAQSLNIATIAEGVETTAQANYLRERGCNLAQGYLFSRPIPASEVPELIASLN